jgi:hypothetical protein
VTSLLPPPNWGLYPELVTMVEGGAFLQRMLKGNSLGVSPAPNWDPALSAKVTTGGLSAPTSRWKARCHLLWIDGYRPPVHTTVLGINIEEPWGNHYGRKTEDHFLARQWSLFLSYHSLLVPGPMTRLLFGANLASP